MRIRIVIVAMAALMLSACNDDPIIGPTDEETDGGSYGVIHFNTSPEAPSEAGNAREAETKNPERF